MTLSAAEADAFRPEPLQPGQARRLDCDDETYFADPCETPSLSQSVAHMLLPPTGCPLRAWQFHPRLGGLQREPTDALMLGTVMHALMLGEGNERLAVIDPSDYRTQKGEVARDFRSKEAKEAKEAALATGKTVITRSDYDEAVKVADILTGRLRDLDIDLREGVNEIGIEWREEDGCPCRGRLDNLTIKKATIYDIKKIRSADPRSCQKSIMNFDYHVQGAAYRSAVGKLEPGLVGRLKFVDLFVELEPPYAVTPLEHDPAMRSLGEARWARACKTWQECLKSGRWPGYVEKTELVTAPAWALMQEEEG